MQIILIRRVLLTNRKLTENTRLDSNLVFTRDLRSPRLLKDVSDAYHSSFPYKHCVLEGWISDNVLRNVRHEILENLVFFEKETDIYKVFQTGDLANLSGLEKDERKRLFSLSALKDALYSDEFRRFLSSVTGCGPLSASVIDISVNMYSQGCHLLGHDDVIGTRSVSFILYLVDPDQPWLPLDGGALRLYSTLCPSFPDSQHEKAIFPAWNQLCFFQVVPGFSFHDVEEVYSEKWRLSISGWFHKPQPGEEGWLSSQGDFKDMAISTLQSLHSDSQGVDQPLIKPIICTFDLDKLTGKLSEDDLFYLKKWINPEYLEHSKMVQLKEAFMEHSMVDLSNFLEPGFAGRVKQWIFDLENAECPQMLQDVETPWKMAKPMHKHRYLYIDCDATASDTPFGLLLHDLLIHPSFYRWLSIWTTLIPHSVFALGRRFRPGMDYTLATPYTLEQPMLNLTLSLTPLGHWGNGEKGGYEVYMEEDKDADASVYRASDDSVLVSHLPTWNTFHIVLRDQGVLRFVKYISKSVCASRWDLVADIDLSNISFS
ncbi:oxidative DNA demethylase [Pneumocystis jirovecii RU7]|uniref:uS12 prolyl 3,4-dihydroxylase n=1 Tax=Pneumocystis jirovecii (strain RU7) TaxID=1408657 RepID=A0A0W4ZIY2_PNEJ7|nr:oxidative DNA demethylase [Pneumocystis jirovecii RU7]KTW28326.1 hypothetical protein T551_02745 [Pneumocystis jirovecii RU7]